VHITSIFKKLLNVKEIVITNIRLERQGKEEVLVIAAKPTKKERGRCSVCGRKSPGYDAGTKARRWRSTDVGLIRVYIEYDLPRVCCAEHGVVAARVPWARHDAWFTKSYEDTVTWLALHSTRSMVAELMRTSWQTVGAITKRVYDDIKKASPDLLDGLERIGIDETSYKKGHKYMMVIVNHDTGALVWAAPKYGKAALDEFFQELGKERCARIHIVTADGARWISDSVEAHCPSVERCIDPFHVVSWATDALDEIRKIVWNDARKQAGPAGALKKPGRPKAGEERRGDAAKEIKGSRYALLKNPENLTASQEATVEMIAKSNPMLYRAYLLKEKLRLVFRYPPEDAEAELDAWIKWAMHSRIPQFVELQRKIKRHKDAILASIRHGVSNARIEAVNNKIKVAIRMGYGFRNLENMIALIMLRCSKLDVALPGRA